MTTENANTPDPLHGEQIVEQETTITSTVQPAVKELTRKDGELYDPLKEQTFIDPKDIAAHLDKENEAAHAADDTVAPYELISNPSHREIADTYVADAQAIARDSGIPAQAVEAILHYTLGEHAAAAERDSHAGLGQGQIPGVDLSNQRVCMTYMRRQFGTMTDTIVADAQAAFRSLPADVQAYLDHDSGTGEVLTNSPALLTALALHKNGYTLMTKEQAVKELAHLRSLPKMDALSKAKLAIVQHIASRGATSENSKLKAALAVARTPKAPVAGVEKRIKELRTHPAYLDRDHASHKEVVAQVSDLYSQLHGTK